MTLRTLQFKRQEGQDLSPVYCSLGKRVHYIHIYSFIWMDNHNQEASSLRYSAFVKAC